jgi:hypothetical protein
MLNLFQTVIKGRKFNFQPIEISNEVSYHVDVKDQEGQRWEFRMVHIDEKQLKMAGEKLPAWIRGLEQELVKAINEHE